MAETVVSVVVPVYETAPFLERCVRSLMEQSMTEGTEFIFVDDATPDESMSILTGLLAQYPSRATQVRILHHAENRGMSAARNTAIHAATGRYLAFVDSDDWVSEKMLEEVTTAAIENDADLVTFDMIMAYEGYGKLLKGLNGSNLEENLKRLLTARTPAEPGNILVRRSLVMENGLFFDERASHWSDLLMSMRVAQAAVSSFYLSRHPYYKRCSNPRPFNSSAAIEERLVMLAEIEQLVAQGDFKKLKRAVDYRRTCVAAHPSTIVWSPIRYYLARLSNNS